MEKKTLNFQEKLKNDICSGCSICGGTGRIDLDYCLCFLKFRAYNILCGKNEEGIDYGFSRKLLDIVSEEDSDIYIFDTFPTIEDDNQVEALIDYISHPEEVFDRGLSLYLYSQEYGRGKTTLAHFLSYIFSEYLFLDLHNYQMVFSKGQDRDNIFFLRNSQDVLDDPEKYMCVPFLVIDDVGNENKSASWKRETSVAAYQRLFHYREDNRLPTIITSNYTPTRLNELYGRYLESLLEITPDGEMRGSKFRSIELGGGEDLRTLYQTGWEI